MERYITFSIDDGNKLDLKLLNLLEKYGFRGTFYVPQEFYLKNLSDEEVRLISRSQEIGGHTLSHCSLGMVSENKQKEEIFGCKKYLENVIEKEINTIKYKLIL